MNLFLMLIITVFMSLSVLDVAAQDEKSSKVDSNSLSSKINYFSKTYQNVNLVITSLQENFNNIGNDLLQFSGVILKGNSKGPLKTNNEFIHSNYWQIGKDYYIVIVNPEFTQKTTVVNLPKDTNVVNYFENRSVDYKKINSKQIKKTFDPLEYIVLKTK